MKKALVFAIALAAATASASSLASRPAVAADDAMAKMDCSKASSMMADADKGSPLEQSGEVDKDFMAIVMNREKGTMMIMKIEAMCGKNAKMKAMAAKQATDRKSVV